MNYQLVVFTPSPCQNIEDLDIYLQAYDVNNTYMKETNFKRDFILTNIIENYNDDKNNRQDQPKSPIVSLLETNHMSVDLLERAKEDYDVLSNIQKDVYKRIAGTIFGAFVKDFDLSGNIVSKFNPHARFDHFTIGGSWNNSIITKDGRKTNTAQLKDINLDKTFPNNKKQKELTKRHWEVLIEGAEKTEIETRYYNNMLETLAINQPLMFNKELMISSFKDKEDYINFHSKYTISAFMFDNKWFDVDTFVMTDVYNKNLFHHILNDPNQQDLYITIVECFI